MTATRAGQKRNRVDHHTRHCLCDHRWRIGGLEHYGVVGSGQRIDGGLAVNPLIALWSAAVTISDRLAIAVSAGAEPSRWRSLGDVSRGGPRWRAGLALGNGRRLLQDKSWAPSDASQLPQLRAGALQQLQRLQQLQWTRPGPSTDPSTSQTSSGAPGAISRSAAAGDVYAFSSGW